MNYVIERLDELLAEVQAAITASDLSDKAQVLVTDDGRKVEKVQARSAGAIVIYPLPGEEWPAPKSARLTWTFGLVASSGTPRASAERIHDLKSVLVDAGILRFTDRADPTDFETTDGPSIPGYAITHTEEKYL